VILHVIYISVAYSFLYTQYAEVINNNIHIAVACGYIKLRKYNYLTQHKVDYKKKNSKNAELNKKNLYSQRKIICSLFSMMFFFVG